MPSFNPFAVRVLSLSSIAAFSCSTIRGGTTLSSTGAPQLLFQETFDRPERVAQNWSAIVPEILGATTQIESGEARLTSPSSGEVMLVHPFEATAVRGRRIRVSARVRTDSPDLDAHVVVAFGHSTQDFRPRVRTSQMRATPASLVAMVDIDSNILRAELSLVLHGKGNAWFDDIKVEVLEPQPTPSTVALSPRQLNNLEALTRAVALVRYRHPSDQAAALDWNTFFPVAIDRVMPVMDDDTLLEELRRLFMHIAPTVEFFKDPPDRAFSGVPRPEGGYLARWRHEGLGPESPFRSWREGRGVDLARLEAEIPVDLHGLARCKKARLRAVVRDVGGDGEVQLYAKVELGGEAMKRFDHQVTTTTSAISLDFDMPPEAYLVRLGLELRGRSAVTLEALSLACDGVGAASIDVTHATWERRRSTDLYTWEPRDCGAARCLTVARRPLATSFATPRDVLDAEILDHVWARVPLAVWSDGVRTLPEPPAWVPPAPGTATSAAERISTLASAWIVLSIFYPDFRDQQIDWAQELPGALASGAAARSTSETFIALSRLIAKLHDAHARAIHGDFPIDGMLPIAMRKFGDKLVVVGGFGEYLKIAPIGSEVTAIDHVAAMQAYEGTRERVSSSTEGWEAWAVPFWLTLGPLGSFSVVHVRTRDAKETELLFPRLSRDLYSSLVREPRPAFGSVLASGIHYVDLEDLKQERWQTSLASLSRARAIILDMRGYPSDVVFTMLGHFIDKEIQSPSWQVPILESSSYRITSSNITPMKPRIDAKLVVLVDGRAASAAETFLQILHENHLATFIGETSAGTNGNPNLVPLPCGFTLRFTGMRVPFTDGSALQGRGIVPDIVIHPTLAGVRAGRDEILEAGIDIAGKLIVK
jgi:hypothetical protein